MLRRPARRTFHAVSTTTAAPATARRPAVAITATGLKALVFPGIALFAAFREIATGTTTATTTATRTAIKIAEVAIASRFAPLFFRRPVSGSGVILLRLSLLMNRRSGRWFGVAGIGITSSAARSRRRCFLVKFRSRSGFHHSGVPFRTLDPRTAFAHRTTGRARCFIGFGRGRRRADRYRLTAFRTGRDATARCDFASSNRSTSRSSFSLFKNHV